MVSRFNHGKVISVENHGESNGGRMGEMLLKGGYLNEAQLQEMLERNRRTGQSFGYILLNFGYVSHEILQGHVRLQTEENMQKLFSWKGGQYRFSSSSNDLLPINEKVFFQESYDGFVDQLRRVSKSSLFGRYLPKRIQETGYDNLQFISAGRSLPRLGDPVNMRVLKRLLCHLKDDYDLVLVDSPPLLEAPDAATLLQIVDDCVFVIKAGEQTCKNIEVAHQKILATNTEIIATVLNQVAV
jgi:hypothetical protein